MEPTPGWGEKNIQKNYSAKPDLSKFLKFIKNGAFFQTGFKQVRCHLLRAQE